MKRNQLNRRDFLKGLGSMALSTPFLPSLLSRAVWAAEPAAPKFVIFVTSCLGHGNVTNWDPSYDATRKTSFSVDNSTGVYQAFEAPLKTRSDGTLSKIFRKPLGDRARDLIFFRGVDLEIGDHNEMILGNYGASKKISNTTFRTQWASQTIDQYLKTLMRAPDPICIGTAIYDGDPFSFKFDASTQKVTQVGHTRPNAPRLFQALFGSAPSPTPTTTPPVGPNFHKTAVDRVIADYRSTLNKLGSADREVFESYIQSLQELEGGSAAAGAVGCVRPSLGLNYDYVISSQSASLAQIEQDNTNKLKVLAAAIKCGKTRIGVYNVESGGSKNESGFKFMDSSSGGSRIHEISHVYNECAGVSDKNACEAKAYDRLAGTQQWIAEEVFLRLLTELDTPSPYGGTYLDHGMIVWVQENHAAHTGMSLPIVVGTRMSSLRPGRYIDYSHAQSTRTKGSLRPGVPYRRFLVSVVDAMGFDGSAMPTTGSLAVAKVFMGQKDISKILSGGDLSFFQNRVAERELEGLPESYFKKPLPRFVG